MEPGTRIQLRNLIGFWCLGLCNNFAYVIMLSAAHDILKEENNETSSHNISGNSTYLECNHISTAAILLADILPTLIVKLLLPFYVNLISYHIKVLLVLTFAAASFLVVGLADSVALSLFGVVCAAIGGGLGEPVFLGLSSHFHKNVVSAWSSGTGGAGLFGALAYAGFTQAGLKPRTTVLIMLSTTVLMAISYFFILKRPHKDITRESPSEQLLIEDDNKKTDRYLTPRQKLKAIPPLLKFMIPLGLVYFAEYFINQGLTELLYFNNFWLSPQDQYRWYQVDYQLGVFISRSSVNLIHIRKIWIMPILQFANVALLLSQVFFRFIPSFWIIIAVILFEGLLGGAAYVNTFYRLYNDSDEEKREYNMTVTSVSDSLGICASGAVSIPVHNAICSLKIKL